jgi:hypothetical protein
VNFEEYLPMGKSTAFMYFQRSILGVECFSMLVICPSHRRLVAPPRDILSPSNLLRGGHSSATRALNISITGDAISEIIF